MKVIHINTAVIEREKQVKELAAILVEKWTRRDLEKIQQSRSQKKQKPK